MGDFFRVVRIKDQDEVYRSTDLLGACVQWVKNPLVLRLNKSATFTERERERFDLQGFPPHVGMLDKQMQYRKKALEDQAASSSDRGKCD
jgi:hypothetical protein